MVTPPKANPPATQFNLLAFNATDIVAVQLNDPSEVTPYLQKYTVVWLNVVGIQDQAALQKVTAIFKLNPLVVDDVTDPNQRTKVEEYDAACFAVSKIPELCNNILHLQQISIFWDQNYVLTFLEHPTDCFNALIEHIKHIGHRERALHPEYLVYSILDVVIDAFFTILEDYGTHLDDLETNAIDNPSTAVIRKIHNLKHDLQVMRRAIWAQRDAVGDFKEIVMRDKDIWFYVRDCEDHTIQLLDIVESYADRGSSLMDIYLVSVNNRTNQIMKQLTIIATVFMPIGVLAGIFGMNFDRNSPWNMPELSWRYGYEFFWCIVITFASTMLFTFWRKGWFKH